MKYVSVKEHSRESKSEIYDHTTSCPSLIARSRKREIALEKSDSERLASHASAPNSLWCKKCSGHEQ